MEEGAGESASCMVCMATYLLLGGVLAYEQVFCSWIGRGIWENQCSLLWRLDSS